MFQFIVCRLNLKRTHFILSLIFLYVGNFKPPSFKDLMVSSRRGCWSFLLLVEMWNARILLELRTSAHEILMSFHKSEIWNISLDIVHSAAFITALCTVLYVIVFVGTQSVLRVIIVEELIISSIEVVLWNLEITI